MKTNNTTENWKKYFYSGIGHLSHTGDVIHKSIKEFARHKKGTEADGRKIVHDAVDGMEQKYNEVLHRLVDFTRSEVSGLQSRLNKMERQMVVKTERVNNSSKQAAKAYAKHRTHIPARTKAAV